MASTYQVALENRVNDLMQDYKWAMLITEVSAKLNKGFWPKEYVDMIFQKFYRQGRPDIYDAYVFIEFHSLLHSGKIGWIQVGVSGVPKPDLAEDENNELLNHLPSPFRAVFAPGRGGNAYNDGKIEWLKPVEFSHHFYKRGRGVNLVNEAIMPRSVPLEVGYTNAGVTWMHIWHGGALARWPYDSKWVNVFVCKPFNEWLQTGKSVREPAPIKNSFVQLGLWA